MCFLTKKKYNRLIEKLDKLNEDRFAKLQSDSDELKQIKELLSYIRLEVKSVASTGEGTVKVVYKAPSVIINGVDRNNLFYAINMLNLISYDDMRKIQNAIDTLEK